ncbi:hypothetical protein EIN_281810 [Entamoeba invadens IP1]|uniref:Uncharacterized protein n=1 Tax=Entamoeba invadens IP1 TaxID=370355 RepID=A0A0A1TWZ3_ENTIV|nr:hypothetical protein EIN_281810 [Entamoeba invadens IP1]ELP85810.1 hypothetical protein EIN_281810 [Entamoeba invadens IP1]|eukprot:XP_004185156.1 hypothetical protein EIN_281810 [Entamoeba invadens IP1]
MRRDEVALIYSLGLVVLLLVVTSTTDSPVFYKNDITDWMCSYNRILCVKNIPPHNDMCEPELPYPPGNERDAILGMFIPKSGWTENHLEMMTFVFYLMRKIVPDCQIVLFLGEQLKGIQVWDEMVAKYQIKAVYTALPKDWNMINHRFVLYKNYLIEHENEIDRAIFCDSKDIYFLRDPFTKIAKNNSLIVGREFRSIDPDDFYSYDGFYQYYNNFIWMKEAYGQDYAEELRLKKAPINNAGFGGGDVKSMITLFTMWTDEMIKIGGQRRWGFDQAVYNKLVYSGELKKKIPFMHLADCKHDRICMFSTQRIDLQNGVPYLFDGCIPHVLHRDGLTYKMMDAQRYPDN